MTGAKDRAALGVQAWSLLLRSHAALVPRIEQDLQTRRRLPLAWYDVCLELNAAPGRRLRMQELGNRVVLSRSRVSRVVDELSTAGFAVKEPDPDDRRGAYAVLTAAGRQAFRSAAPVYLAAIADRFTAQLTDTELHAVIDGLTRVLAAAQD